MLDGLDKVDWGAVDNYWIKESGIDPTQIPVMLRQLLSKDSETRQYALAELDLQLTHEDYYIPNPLMLQTLPFFFELLDYDQFQEIASVLDLLGIVLMESSFYSESQPFDGDDLISQYCQYIKSQTAIFHKLFTNESPAIRCSAIGVWSHLPVSDDTIRTVLNHVIDDPDKDLQVFTARYVVEFVRSKGEINDVLFQEVVDVLLWKFSVEAYPPYQALLAYSVLKLQKENISIQVITTLIQSLKKHEVYKLQKVSWMVKDFLGFTHIDFPAKSYHIITMLYECGLKFAYRPLLEILSLYKSEEIVPEKYDEFHPSTTRLYLALLDLMFNTTFYKELFHRLDIVWSTILDDFKPIPDNDDPIVTIINSEQLEFLTRLLDDEYFWARDHNLLVWYGLPASRETLREFVVKSSRTIE